MTETLCLRCRVPMKRGLFIRQTVNRLRPSQTVGTLYPCGPGVLAICLKCPKCGHSIEKESK